MNERIHFLDLAKGVCMILLVLQHCGAPCLVPGLELVAVPLFFVLSGLLARPEQTLRQTVVKRLRTVLLPFAVWYAVGYLAFYLILLLAPHQMHSGGARGVLDVFLQRQFFNGPIWFLLCLWWVSLFFALATHRRLRWTWLKALIISLLGYLGWWLGERHIFLPLFVDVALTALPFYAFGHFLSRRPWLFAHGRVPADAVTCALLWALSFVLYGAAHPYLSFHYNNAYGLTRWPAYVCAIASVVSLLLACKLVSRIPPVNLIGRNTMTILCVHHLLYRPLALLLPDCGDLTNTLVALLTLALSLALAPLIKKHIPWAVGR